MDYHKVAADVSKKMFSYSQDTTGWKPIKSSKNVAVSWKTSNDYAGNIYRGEGIIEGTPEEVIPFMYLPEYRSKWDKNLKYYSLIEHIDENTVIGHILTHSYGMGIISSREFVDLIHIKKYEGGVITTNTISVEHAKCPVTASYVRAHNNPCGYICSPLPENPAHSKLVVFFQPELGGLLPRSLVESVLPNNAVNLINDARKGLQKHLYLGNN
ncbi:stAR-related lipid transfer protein 6 [Discoglossus pictus]